MATAFTHAVVGGLLGGAAPRALPRARLAVTAALLAVLPDLDVVAFSLGIPYAHPLGHRGLSHSLVFAVVAGALGAAAVLGRAAFSRAGVAATAVLAVATASHGLLDAFTDAGLGVGFFVPFSDARFFFPVRPLATSPIGVEAFFSGPALRILGNEIVWVWLPVLAGAALLLQLRRRRS